MHHDDEDAKALAAIEAGMVAIRRRQTRRAMARAAAAERADRDTGGDVDPAVFDVVDAVEDGEDAGRPVTVTDVAAALGVAQPRASKLVAAAVDAGLVRREADQRDGRRALLVRTEAGRRLSERVHAVRRGRFARATEGWTADERAVFAALLTRFVAGLAEQ